jgi:hypothetical protein
MVHFSTNWRIYATLPANAAEAVHSLVNLIGHRNFVTFQEIEAELGLSFGQIVRLKPSLETYYQALPDSGGGYSVTSRIDLNPPGLFIEG